MSRFDVLGMREVRRQNIVMKSRGARYAEFTVGGKTLSLKGAFAITKSPSTSGRVSAPVVWVGLRYSSRFPRARRGGQGDDALSDCNAGGRNHSDD